MEKHESILLKLWILIYSLSSIWFYDLNDDFDK